MAVKKTQMYRKNLDTSETNLYPLTEAQYVSMENGQTVQEILSDRDSDKYTPVITNSSSTFKVGQGDNVDLSSSMKEGAYDSCVLKGKTMVNCIQEPSSQDVVLPYAFEDGQYVTINDTKESGALGVELKGQTLVNLAKVRTATAYNRCSEKNIAIKPNTKYIALFNPTYYEAENGVNYALLLVSSVSLNDSVVGGDDAYTKSVSEGRGSEYKPRKGDRHLIFTSKANETYLHIRTGGNNGILYTDMIVLEYQEGMEDWDIPYFTGMTSCKMPILHTVGKNLFNHVPESLIGKTSYGMNVSISNGKIKITGTPTGTYGYVEIVNCVEKGKQYTFSAYENGQLATSGYRLWVRYSDGTLSNPASGGTFVVKNLDIVRVEFVFEGFTVGTAVNKEVNIQIEESPTQTSYETHKSSILSLPEEVVLRSLPNGVRDTFNTRTGVYTQRIGELVFDGSDDEDWRLLTASSNWVNFSPSVCTFVFPKPSNCALTWGRRDNENSYLTNKFPAVPSTDPHAKEDKEKLMFDSTNIKMAILKTSLKTEDVEGLRIWLSQNPIVTQYELATPIITKINLSSTLKSWNTTTHIYSEIPENTLYPILSHSNATYPVILKPSTKYSIVANSYSNGHTNSPINFNLGGATATTTVGNRVTTITTPSTLSNELLTMSGRGNKLNNVMVIEGDVVGDEPYFEGMCDSKSPILSNIGETILETPFEKEFGTDAQKEFFRIVDCAEIFDNFGVGKQYTLSLDIKANKSGAARIYLQNGSGSRHNFSFDIPVTTEYVRHTKQITPTMAGDGHNFKESWLACFTTYNTGCFATIKNIRISTGEDEPYKSNILSCETYFDETTQSDKTIVLRSLPNGVCDTLNVETGEYVQRIGDYTVNGTETSWFTYIDTTGVNNNYLNQTSCAFGFHLTGKVKGNGILCDKLPTRSIGWWASGNTGEGICGIDNDNRIFLRVKNEKTGVLYTDNVSTALGKAKAYFTNNPVTVQYQLETPIVTTIDVQGFPYAYTNGHVQLSSGSIEQSLTPKVEYSLSANKTGQINSNTKRVSAHQKQLDDFEAMMLTQMVQSAYDKAILQFDYEMQMMSLGGE